MRNAWSLIYHINVSMGVFEDDVRAKKVNESVRLFKKAASYHKKYHNDITFVEDAPGWYRNAAILISPKGAFHLLGASKRCLKKRGTGVDGAHHRRVCSLVKCKRFKGICFQDRENSQQGKQADPCMKACFEEKKTPALA